MVSYLFFALIFLSFVFGQFARLPLSNGVYLTLIDVTVVTFSLFFTVSYLIQKKGKFVKSPLFVPWLLFCVAAVISLLANSLVLRTSEIAVASLYLLRFCAYTLPLFFLPFFSKNQKLWLVRVLIVSVLVTVGVGFVQFVYYPNLRNLFYLGWDDHLYRLFSVFLDPNFASVLFSCLFIVLVGLTVEFIRIGRMKAVGLAGLSVLTALAVFLTYSRTGMIALVIGTIVLFFLKGYKRLLLVCLGVFVLFLAFTADLKVEGLNPFRTASSVARIESIKIAFGIFEKNPIFGVGFNAYRYAQHRYGFRLDGVWETSHADAGTDNSFLFVLATTGIVGFSAYLYFWYVLLSRTYATIKQEKSGLPVIVFATLIAVLVSSLFLNTLFYPFILIWIVSLFGVMERK
ncbi:MAG: O-antigen ligase family protein [Candidatus Levybacteria bacterium]|nr:O-antigen ligase family protein [Candidatus Levybacteria bacterium]